MLSNKTTDIKVAQWISKHCQYLQFNMTQMQLTAVSAYQVPKLVGAKRHFEHLVTRTETAANGCNWPAENFLLVFYSDLV